MLHFFHIVHLLLLFLSVLAHSLSYLRLAYLTHPPLLSHRLLHFSDQKLHLSLVWLQLRLKLFSHLLRLFVKLILHLNLLLFGCLFSQLFYLLLKVLLNQREKGLCFYSRHEVVLSRGAVFPERSGEGGTVLRSVSLSSRYHTLLLLNLPVVNTLEFLAKI
jgi:hypothetical protein